MSLLPEGCVINGMTFDSCQLHRRHWLIRDNDVVVSDFSGEAVIGMVSSKSIMLLSMIFSLYMFSVQVCMEEKPKLYGDAELLGFEFPKFCPRFH